MANNNRREYLINVLLERLPGGVICRMKGLGHESAVTVKSPSRLKGGRDVTIQSSTLLHCGGKPWCGYEGFIELGNSVVLGPRCILYGAGGIRIGDFTHLGPGAMVITSMGIDDEQRLTPNPVLRFEPVTIGPGGWIGAGAVILGGTTLGKGCTVAPNSVVKGEYPAGSTLIGNPARLSITMRKRTSDR